MDINKENNLADESVAESAETLNSESEAVDAEVTEVAEESAETDVTEVDTESAENAAEINASESEDDGTEDNASTLLVSAEDIDEELMRYGISSQEEETETFENYFTEPVKKSVVQKPIIIAALSFLLTAVLVFGGYFVYGLLSPKGVEGTWIQANSEEDPNLFLVIEDGNITMNIGGYQRYGYYELEEVNGFTMLKTDFYEFVIMGKNIVVSFSEDNKIMSLYFIYDGVDLNTFDPDTTDLSTVSMGNIDLKRGKISDLDLTPETISHASADELGITALNVDEGIVGTWRLEIEGAEGKFDTYTFNADGTGSHDVDYIYYEMYGCGLGERNQFTYTVYDNKILMTTTYFDGNKVDMDVEYYLDKGNLVINGVGFEKVN